ncbi:YIEGIA domain-containing protein [Desmospora profundinema]|uniref:YIEGIA protein n=1 Tax=Desmospora profundinema TaxID=1571184 RepID=A0ABU1IPR1_9BACL|nr:YIEGIA domain-containing protein [Desmospora profundinema]MDR6226787.1 hypothetical protein [Desmospora profundinema]
MENNGLISPEYLVMITTAVITGTLARVFTMKQDYRQYPSYPSGFLIHFVTAAVAAALGAFVIPALMTKNFIAVTFLTLAIQQFREVRKTEKESLQDLEKNEYTPRGDAYIDGIAKTFESRNYFSLLISFVTALTMQVLEQETWIEVTAGVLAGAILFLILKQFTKGKKVNDVAVVKRGKIDIKGSDLYVDDIFVSNLAGSELAKTLFQKNGLGVVIHPKHPHYNLILEHFGQRQAMLHESTRAVGLRMYSFSFQNYTDDRVVIALVPIEHNFELLKETILNTPLLESVKKAPELMDNPMTGGQQ